MARITKNDIYTSYGIEFNGKQIRSPFGTWISPLLVDGNTKVGKKAKTWSIMHGNENWTAEDFKHAETREVFTACGVESVKGSCPCHCDGCYCDSGCFVQYHQSYTSNLFKLILARMFLDWTKRAIIAQIKADKITQVRIHAAGDFFSVEYINAWHEIIFECKETTIFWTYTKNRDAEKAFSDLDNCFLVPSITPYGFNFGTCAELLSMYARLTEKGYKVHICACGTEYETHCCDCNTGCKAVGTECDFVLFIKHSTKDYKAGKNDPTDFEAVKDIIRSQKN